MPAELPRFPFGWDELPESSRREFLGRSVRIAGATGLIYVAPWLLAGCGPENSGGAVGVDDVENIGEEIPPRAFTPEWISWKAEQELEKRDYLLGRVAILSGGGLVVEDIGGGTVGRMEIPGFTGAVIHELTFSPDSEKIVISTTHGDPISHASVLTVKLPEFHIWSPLTTLRGQPFVGSVWSHDSKYLATRVSDMGRIFYLRVVHYQGGNFIGGRPVNMIERPINLPKVGGFMKFSPNDEWLAHDSGKRVSLWELKTNKHFEISEGYIVDWLPDGKSLLFTNESDELLAYDSEMRKTRKIASLVIRPIRISPDGQFVYVIRNLARNYYELDRIPVNSSEDKLADVRRLHRFNFNLTGRDSGWTPNFIVNSRGELLIVDYRGSHKPINLIKVNEKTGAKQEYSLEHPGQGTSLFPAGLALNDLFFYESSGNNDNRIDLYVFSFKTGQRIKVAERFLSGKVAENSLSAHASYYGHSIYSLGDGDVLEYGRKVQIVSEGRRYEISAGPLIGVGTPIRLPSYFANRIPESENKLEFREGEILAGPDGRAWYLQNGGRYPVNGDLQKFAQARFRNFKVREVPQWVVEKVKKLEIPHDTFLDQYGREIDARSPRLVCLMAGLGTEAQDVPTKVFSEIVQGLKLLEWRDNQIVFVSHRTDRDENGNLTPVFYTQDDALSPIRSREGCGLFFDWLTTRAPLSQIIGCGHSMGGDAIFHTAVTRPEIFCQVVTINSPLLGVDENYLGNETLSPEDLAALGCAYFKDFSLPPPLKDMVSGCQAVQFYANAGGNNPGYATNVINSADDLQKSGTEVFTFSAVKDPIAPTARAVLTNSKRRIGDYEVTLSWDLSHYDPAGKRKPILTSAHGLLLSHKPFIAELLRVIGRP